MEKVCFVIKIIVLFKHHSVVWINNCDIYGDKRKKVFQLILTVFSVHFHDLEQFLFLHSCFKYDLFLFLQQNDRVLMITCCINFVVNFRIV